MNILTERFLDYALGMAQAAGAGAIVVYADVFQDKAHLKDFMGRAGKVKVVLVARSGRDLPDPLDADVVKVPDVKLTRLGQIKVAVLLGLCRGIFHEGDTLVCLTGVAMTGEVDGLMLTEVGSEYELFSSGDASDIAAGMSPEVLERIIDISVALGNYGREGKAVGTTFVLGDTDSVLEYCEPLLLNPFHGYPPEQRNILEVAVTETVKEFSTIDGAFIVRENGVVEAAGMFLRTEARNVVIPRGLGARHKSAAAITALTKAVAVTVSESSGNVSVFHEGAVVFEIENPHLVGVSGGAPPEVPSLPESAGSLEEQA